MKLKIELDIEPHEVELATELVNTLRALTDHVKVNAQAKTGQVSAATPAQPVESLQQPLPRAVNGSPKAPASIEPAPVQNAQPSKPAPAVIARPATATAPGSGSAPSSRPDVTATTEQDLPAKVSAYQQAAAKRDNTATRQIAESIAATLPSILDTASVAYLRLADVLEGALFTPPTGDSLYVAETCQLLTELPGDYMNDLKTRIISTALKHLMIKRPVATNRNEFFAHASVFAAMIQLEFILISGAVQTISKLMKKEETRAAALTMLGAATEVCSEQLLNQVDDKKMDALRAALEEVSEPELEYDKKYITEALGWQTPSNGKAPPVQEPATGTVPAAASTDPLAGQAARSAPSSLAPVQSGSQPVADVLQLLPQAQWTGYEQNVKGVVVDDLHGQVVTTCNDGTIRLHSIDGKELQRIDLKTHSYIDLDFNAANRVIACASIPLKAHPDTRPAYAGYQLKKGSLTLLGSKEAPAKVTNLLKLRFLAKGSQDFVSAEGTASKKLLVSRYSSDSFSDISPLVPLASFETDHGMITAISAVPSSALAYLSADKSGKIYIWNVKSPQPKPVVTLGPPPLGKDLPPNAGVITCLDTLDPNFVLAGTYGHGVHVWDLRMLAQGMKEGLPPCATIELPNEAVTRLAKVPNVERQIVIATANNIFTFKLNQDGSLARKVEGKKKSPKYYWDAKWGVSNGVKTLYAASAGPPGTVDVYSAIPA